MTLEDIGTGDDALLCMTNLTAPSENTSVLGDWYFPNGTRNSGGGDFYTTRSQTVVGLNRNKGGPDGMYRCEILDSMNVTQTIYIGVHTASSGEWHCLYTLWS